MPIVHREYAGGVVAFDHSPGNWPMARGVAFPPQDLNPPQGAALWRTDLRAWYSWDRVTQAWSASGGACSTT